MWHEVVGPLAAAYVQRSHMISLKQHGKQTIGKAQFGGLADGFTLSPSSTRHADGKRGQGDESVIDDADVPSNPT